MKGWSARIYGDKPYYERRNKLTGRQRGQLEVGDSVMSRDYRGDLKRRSGLIFSKTGPLMYEVQVALGIIWR